jgi:hypothetical protein
MVGRHVHPWCTSVAVATYPQTCWGPQQILLLAEVCVWSLNKGFGLVGSWDVRRTCSEGPYDDMMYVAPGLAEQDNFLKVCPCNQEPWVTLTQNHAHWNMWVVMSSTGNWNNCYLHAVDLLALSWIIIHMFISLRSNLLVWLFASPMGRANIPIIFWLNRLYIWCQGRDFFFWQMEWTPSIWFTKIASILASVFCSTVTFK